MSSIKDRQRAAARARLEKEMAERTANARNRRRRIAIVSSVLVIVVVGGGIAWVGTVAHNRSVKKAYAASHTSCTWTKETATQGEKIKDTGGTPPKKVSKVGKDTLTISTNLGDIVASVDKSKAPCTAAAFEYLTDKSFWNNTKCHRLTTAGILVLQCGDPFATGKGYAATDGAGSANFKYKEENLPVGKDPTYPAGTIAMAKASDAGTTSSQFFIVDKDIPAASLSAEYTILGTVSSGMDIIDKVEKGGSDNANATGDGHPKIEVDIKTMTMAAAK